jgi:hypothetical protein
MGLFRFIKKRNKTLVFDETLREPRKSHSVSGEKQLGIAACSTWNMRLLFTDEKAGLMFHVEHWTGLVF